VRWAIAAALPVYAWTAGDGEDPGAFTAGLIGAVLLVTWMAVGAVTKVALLRSLEVRRVGETTTARRCLAWALRRGRAIAGFVLARRRDPHNTWRPEAALVLPILASTDDDLDAARRRSAALRSARWGGAEVEAGTPALIGIAGLLASLVVAFPALAVTGAASIVGQLVALTVLVAGLTAATLARAVLAYAVFRHQVDGEAPFGLRARQLDQLVTPRR
jgi:hypothetical protein